MAIRVRSVYRASSVTCQRIHGSDDGGGQTGTADLEPSSVSLVAKGIVDRRPGVGIRVSRDVYNGASYTFPIHLPGGLSFIGTTAASRATPHGFTLVGVIGIQG